MLVSCIRAERKVALTVENSHFSGLKVESGQSGLGFCDNFFSRLSSRLRTPLYIPSTFRSLHMSDSERFARTEAALAALNDVVALIVKQLDTVQSKSRTPVPCDMPHTPSKSPNPSPTHFAKPATPDNFAGDRDKGCAFLNSCNLYFALALHRFPDDVTRILWVLSFMKSDRAALFVDRSLRTYRISGRLPFESWLEFSTAFVTDFCPKNEVQAARTILESSEYFQGH